MQLTKNLHFAENLNEFFLLSFFHDGQWTWTWTATSRIKGKEEKRRRKERFAAMRCIELECMKKNYVYKIKWKRRCFFARSAHSQRAHTTLELLCLFIFSQTIRLTREEPTNNVTRSDRTNLLLFTSAAYHTLLPRIFCVVFCSFLYFFSLCVAGVYISKNLSAQHPTRAKKLTDDDVDNDDRMWTPKKSSQLTNVCDALEMTSTYYLLINSVEFVVCSICRGWSRLYRRIDQITAHSPP